MPTIATIAVHYRNHEQSLHFAKQMNEAEIPLWIVDNSAALRPLALPAHPLNTVIPAPENPGYFGALRKAMTALLDQESLPDWLIIANTDIHIDIASLKQLTDPSHPANLDTNIGILAPRVISSISGHDSNPLYTKRPSPRHMAIVRLAFESYLTGALWQVAGWVKTRLFHTSQPIPERMTPIYAAHGSFFILNKRYFEKGLDLAYPVFLYGEELWLAEQCRKADLSIQHCPDIVCTHIEHGSIGIWPNRRVWMAHRDSNRFIQQLYSEA